MKKNLIVAATAVTLSLGAVAPIASTMAAHAASSSTTSSTTSLVDKIATKFNLKKADVQALFDEDRTAHEAEQQQAFKEKLAAAVTAGTLTQAQADKITAKRAELQAARESNRTAMQGKTDSERKAAMDAERNALQKWATDNGIDMSYLMGDHGGRGPGGPPPSN